MLPSSQELKYFVEIARTENVSRAAERLGLSQPSLSLAIQRLEQNLGVPLLIRSKAGVKLTRAGARFANQARMLISEWDRLRTRAVQSESEICGRYVLGCHPSVALYTLYGVIPELLNSHPGMEFKLVHDLSRKILEEIISFKVDIGLVVNPVRHPDLVIKHLFDDVVTFWTSQKKSSLTDPFSGKAVLICDPELAQTQSLLKQLAKKKIEFDRIITSTSLEVVAELTSAGAGIGVIPTRVAARAKGLQHASPLFPKFQDEVCLVYRADMQKSKGNKLLIQAIEKLVLSLE
jgi:LysR family transcriptional regulator, cell division regulator